jgi:hypothetical protein
MAAPSRLACLCTSYGYRPGYQYVSCVAFPSAPPIGAHDKAAADAARPSVVAKAERSEAAQRKARNRCTDDGLPVHSFRSLLADLATVTRNVMAMDGAPEASFVLYPQLTPVQDRVFQLLDIGVKV